ncbi:type II toxin-antitoxin system Phd/YefM family antitoxin [Undibacterium sp. TC9W]|uniref:type II toxin-antitoxin system Phd/YefM family antitoxin n=1 Tax=Undibacterium sp. TC9W TaxID=3413053 RepID=UPI003BEFA921
MHTDHSVNIKKLRRHAKAVLREAILEPVMILDDEIPAAYLVSVEKYDTMNKKLHDIHGLERLGKLSSRKPAKAFADEL